MTVFDRLQQKIKSQLGINAKDFTRNHPGKWMRSQGAFVWEATTDGGYTIGSTWTASELLNSSTISMVEHCFKEIELFPND